MLVNKPINLELLQAELAAAGKPVPSGLVLYGDRLLAAQNGNLVELPAGSQAVVDAHIADSLTPAQQTLKDARDQARAFYRLTNAEWTALTAAQKADGLRNAWKALAYVVARDTT